MNKTIIKLSLIAIFIGSITFSVHAHDIVVEEVVIVPKTLADTLAAHTVSGNYDYVYEPSVEDLAMDSFLNSPDRVELPNTIDNDSVKMMLAPIMLNKVRLDNGILVADIVKEDFTSLGLPPIVYDYFLQGLNDLNFKNQLYQRSEENIQTQLEEFRDEMKRALFELNLKTQHRELIAKNKELFEVIEKVNFGKQLTLQEVKILYPLSGLLSNKFMLRDDGKLVLNVSKEQLDADHSNSECMRSLLIFFNINFELENYLLQEKEDLVDKLNDMVERLQYYLTEHQYE